MPSENYLFERDSFKLKNKNRGADKVALFNIATRAWEKSKFLMHVHRPIVQSNESKEGRKLDIAGRIRLTRMQ